MIVEPEIGGDGSVKGQRVRDFDDDGTGRDDDASVWFPFT